MNKRSLLLLLMLLLIISTAFVACTMEEYTVTFVVDGETYHTTTVSKEPIVMPEDPTKTGYMFSGWYNGDVKFDGSASVTKNITLTAKWRANSYNVSLDTNGGECDTQTLQVVYGENATLPVATKNGYSFAGWQYNNQLIDGNNWSIANDCTLVAQWTTLAYQITYNLDGGTNSNSNPMSYTVVDNFSLQQPTKEGYTFMGWTTDSNSTPAKDIQIAVGTTGNKTYTANWQANTYTITYDANGGTVAQQTQQVTFDEQVSLLIPTRNGYTFDGWYLNDTKYEGGKYAIANNITLKAKWSIITYDIAYNLNGGVNNDTNPATYNVENAITLGQPTKTGYSFVGWITENVATPTKDIQIAVGTTGNKTYTAKWQANTYTITYDANGGTVAQQTQQVTFDEQVSLLIPTRNGYTFAGWQYNSQIVDIEKWNIADNCTFVAQWEAIVYGITYELGVTSSNSNPASYTIENNVVLQDLSQEGYTFLGWTTDGTTEPTKTLQISVGSTGNKTFVAHWQIITYAVTYQVNGGVETEQPINSFTVEQLPLKLQLNSTSKDGHYFAGWYFDEHLTLHANEITTIGDKTIYAKFIAESQSLEFTLADDGQSYIVTGYNGNETEVVIPSYYNDLPVTAIGDNTFKNCIEITSIFIPEGVTTIGKSAFVFCTNLTDIYIPQSVVSIEQGAFIGCSKLHSLYIPSLFAWCSANIDSTSGSNPLYYATELYVNKRAVTDTIILDDFENIWENCLKNIGNLSVQNIVLSDRVISIGNRAFSGYSRLTSITISDSVTSIGAGAFSGCSSLTSIIIPDSVTSIGAGAFSGCSSLESITLPFVGGSIKSASDTNQYPFGYIFGTASYDGGTAITQYYYGTNVTYAISATYYIPNSLQSVTIIGGNILYGAFYNCGNLTNVVIPNSTTSIEDSAFRNCTNLTSITISESIISIGDRVFYNCSNLISVYFEESSQLTFLGSAVFYNCSGLKNIVIPNSATSIGAGAFSGCSSLESITLPFVGATQDGTATFSYVFGSAGTPASLRQVILTGGSTIADYAFQNCSSLTSILIPNSVTSIGSNAFQNCSSLTSIIIPDTVTSIGTGAFSGCSSLESITLPFVGGSIKSASDTNQYPFGYIFGTASYDGGKATTQYYNSSTSLPLTTYYIPTSLQTVTITGGNILYGAFYNCGNLTNVVINDGITSIGYEAFHNCKNLTSVTFGENSQLTSIGSYAFNYCSSLTNIIIPDSVTSIGSYAFAECDNLQYYEYEGGLYLGNANNNHVVLIKVKDTSIVSCQINESTKFIYSSAFSSCVGLASLTIPDSIISIGDGAFLGCWNLTNVTFCDNSQLTTIGSQAFEYCSSLTSITIPDSVTSIGTGAFSGCSSLTSVYITDISAWCNIQFGGSYANPLYYGRNLYLNDELVTELLVPNNVTDIGIYAFQGCSSLINITIPDTVTSIGRCAFNGCSGLTSVTFGENSQLTIIDEYAFSGCSSLESITIGNAVKSINESAFSGCANLTSVTFRENSQLTIIDIDVFYNCSSLKSIIIPDSVTYLGNYDVFRGCSSLESVTIGNSVRSIGTRVFYNCSSLTEIIIPDSVKAIGDYAFYNCSSLETVTIGNSATSIGSYTFQNCSKLTSITIPDSVTTISTSAFAGCSSLENVYISDIAAWCNIQFIYADANPLHNGANLYINGELIKNLVIPAEVTAISRYAFSGCGSLENIFILDNANSIGYSAFSDCSNLISITIPNSVTTIDGWAFQGCSNLTNIIIPNGITSISNGTFSNCVSLTNVKISESVTSIDMWAFEYCSSLTSIAIPDSVKSIGERAFYNCSSLTNITIPDSVTAIGSGAFSNCSSLMSVIFSKNSLLTAIDSGTFSHCSSLASIVIPSSVTLIGDMVFYGCSSLETIYYLGTANQWDNIVIDYGNTELSNATRYYYSEAEPVLNADGNAYNGNYWRYVDGVPTVWKIEE